MTYVSPNQIKDGTTRAVVVSMSNDDLSANGTNSYYIPGVIVPGLLACVFGYIISINHFIVAP